MEPNLHYFIILHFSTMANTTRKQQIWVKIDFWVQAALVAATIGMSIFSSPFFLLVMAIPLGFWQSMGGLVHFFAFKKSDRKPYLLGVLAFGVVFFAMEQYHLMDATAYKAFCDSEAH